ncbi:MAG: HAMP domain-containing histidine kinase [Candidatus Dormibacteraeota bacterium]|nr:HAMP domain-containing histidine kinase [Candidatus Dormibacteraeota bacterium]
MEPPDAGEEHDLMSVLGHELRSPLTSIRGAATLLIQAHADLAPAKVEELLHVIDRQSGRLADRVEDILVAGRVDAGRLAVFVEDVSVGGIVADEVETARLRSDRRRVRATGPLHGTVSADRERLQQVIRILLDNAIRFSSPPASVELRVQQFLDTIRIEVRDRGPGVPAADRGRIFDRGVKLDAAGPGAGLGLYVARALVEAMAGEIGVEARPGGGAVFWFSLPLAK